MAAVLVAAATMLYGQDGAARVVKVTGDAHRLALMSDGRVFGWRQFRNGQLGRFDRINVETGLFTTGPILQELPGKVIDIAAGNEASYAVLDDGSVWAWGRGDYGQLGTGPNPVLSTLPSDSPAMQYRGVDRAQRVRVGAGVAVAAAGHFALAVLRDGTVRAWGLRGPLGDGGPSSGMVFEPVAVLGVADVAQVSASSSHVLVLTKSGRVFGWGDNSTGALGRDPAQTPRLDRADEVPGLTDVAGVAAAYQVSTALKRDGTVWVWGSNQHGQFGDGVHTSSERIGARFTPQPVAGIANVVAMTSSSGRQTIVLLKDGTLRGWGNTDFGQIGAGISGTYQAKPVTPKIAGVSAVFAAGNNTFAVKTDGTFWGWGNGGRQEWPFKVVMRVPALVDLR